MFRWGIWQPQAHSGGPAAEPTAGLSCSTACVGLKRLKHRARKVEGASALRRRSPSDIWLPRARCKGPQAWRSIGGDRGGNPARRQLMARAAK